MPRQLQTAKKDCKVRKKKKKTVTWVFHSDVTSTLVKHQQFSILSFRSTHLSSRSRQCTKIGNIPDFIRSSMGGLRSLESSFLSGKGENTSISRHIAGRDAGKAGILFPSVSHALKDQPGFIFSTLSKKQLISKIQISELPRNWSRYSLCPSRLSRFSDYFWSLLLIDKIKIRVNESHPLAAFSSATQQGR